MIFAIITCRWAVVNKYQYGDVMEHVPNYIGSNKADGLVYKCIIVLWVRFITLHATVNCFTVLLRTTGS